MAKKQKILVIVGPTASGKSALGVDIAKKFNGEVISADSRQVYRGLDIGTGKITKREMKGVPHHLLDVASPKKTFSAGEFVKRGRRAIADIARRGKLPIVVGGTGFYIDALVGRITLPDAPPDASYRERLNKLSTSKLFALLRKLDPARSRAMSTPSERSNKARLIRALEIVRALGKSPERSSRPLYEVLWIGIVPTDSELRRRINARLKVRLKSGMVREAKRLHRGHLSYKRMEELGLEYRSLARYLTGRINAGGLEKELQSAIWRYARKQLGYWNRNGNIRWFKPDSKQIERGVRAWFKTGGR